MKKLLFLFLLLSANFSMAQPPAYDDLLMYYTDEQWEKLIKAAEKYTLKEETKSDPIAYLWLAKGLYKMSLSGNTDETYKNAYKDAITAMGKFTKLDKSGSAKSSNEKFVEEFKSSLVETISNELGNPKKAVSWVTKYYKLDPKSMGTKYLEAACKYLDADKSSANVLWKEAEVMMTDATKNGIDSYSVSDKQMLKLGILKTVECYVASRQTEKAKVLLGKVAQWFEDDEDFKAVYDDVVN